LKPSISKARNVGNPIKLIIEANGYVFYGIGGDIVEFNKIVVAPLAWDYYKIILVQEKYMNEEDER
jgi:hypothetical protein